MVPFINKFAEEMPEKAPSLRLNTCLPQQYEDVRSDYLITESCHSAVQAKDAGLARLYLKG